LGVRATTTCPPAEAAPAFASGAGLWTIVAGGVPGAAVFVSPASPAFAVDMAAIPGGETLPPTLGGGSVVLGTGMLAAGVCAAGACPEQAPVIATIRIGTQTVRVARRS